MKRFLCLLFISLMIVSYAIAQTEPVRLSSDEDLARIMELLGVKEKRQGKDGMSPSNPNYANYDETKANPYADSYPDVLTLKNGQKVTTAEQWNNQRRPEIVEDFAKEVYGRVPDNVPKVTWQVTGETEGLNGDIPIKTKTVAGHVDNSSYPAISVDIQVTVTTPADAAGPVPVIIQFGGGFGGGMGGGTRGRGTRGGATAPRGGAAPQRGNAGPGANLVTTPNQFMAAMTDQPNAGRRGSTGARGGMMGGFGGGGMMGGGARGGNSGPSWQQRCLEKGWGYGTLNPGSIQADNGSGLTSGIIGLCNKGQPRDLDDWGALRAWAWGADRMLDYFETDSDVDAKQVGITGHSRYGKAALLALAYNPRMAIAYPSSSGAAGASLWRRNWGEIVENVAAASEYHWMCGNFVKYACDDYTWNDIPVDSHELVALCAPKPVFISGGAGEGGGMSDQWVDAKGMWMAGKMASPVYELLGAKGSGFEEYPGLEVLDTKGEVGFRQHSAGHTDAPNWPFFIDFANKYLKAPEKD
ncbi:MAG: hypothetical protein JXA96_05495 [Sedimentisphaerales bacterium]|nr:hypothetical protein [Sedimentisphaerales bacterium]